MYSTNIVIGILSLVVGLIAFIFGNDENKKVRYVIGGFALIASILLITLALFLDNTATRGERNEGKEAVTFEDGNTSQSQTVSSIDVDGVLANIVPGQGGIEVAAPWWHAVDWANVSNTFDPTRPPGAPGCYGIAWNANGLNYAVLIFDSQQDIQFQSGGTYVTICFPDDIVISPYDAGRIQANWNQKEYGGTWRVELLD